MKGKYEAIIVISVKNGDEAVETLKERFKALIEDNGTLESVDEWGKRRLAYAINYETEGYYVLYNFESETSFPAEFERISRITDGILRSIVVRKQEA